MPDRCPHPATDSARLYAAGAYRVFISSPGQTTSIQRTDVDTPLEEAAAFLAALSKNKGLKILVDDGLAKTPINLRVNDLELGSAVEWIARLADGAIVKSGDTIKIARK